MPVLYIYSPSDFVTGLPDEVSAAADGTPTFTLTLKAGATPTRVKVTDDDLIFDEVDATQSLTNALTFNGSSYAAGTTINTAYDLINTTTGHKVTSLHFGGDGYQQGAVDGLVSTVLMTPGVSYTFNTERTSHLKNNAYTDYAACFTSETMIETKRGVRQAQDLKAGEMIRTLDHGFQPLRMILCRTLCASELVMKPNLRPIKISAGALGDGLPSQDLVVSPQHRILVNSPIVKRMFGVSETLIAAKKLTALPGIFVCDDLPEISYFHLILDRHEIVFSDGAPTESYFCGPMAVKSLCPATRDELSTHFPNVTNGRIIPKPARILQNGRKLAKLVQRHEKNSNPLLTRCFGSKLS